MHKLTPELLISQLKLKPLDVEGGFYYETYRSDETVLKEGLPERYGKDKHISTAIYFLLTSRDTGILHKLFSDEIFHFYLGDPVRMLLLYPNGNSNIVFLGNNILAGQRIQMTVPNGVWQGCSLVEGGEFALMGTTVSPAFDFEDFEPGSRSELVQLFPHHKELIELLTKEN